MLSKHVHLAGDLDAELRLLAHAGTLRFEDTSEGGVYEINATAQQDGVSVRGCTIIYAPAGQAVRRDC